MSGGKVKNKMSNAEFRKLNNTYPKIGKDPSIIPTEKQIEREILAYLELRTITSWKQNNGCLKAGDRFVKFFMDAKGKSIKGMPDIAGYLPNGRALYIEVKRPKKYPTPEQRAFIINAQESGCLAFIAHSVQEVHEVLLEEGY